MITFGNFRFICPIVLDDIVQVDIPKNKLDLHHIFPEKINMEQHDLLKSILPETIFSKIDDSKKYTNFTLSEYNKRNYERDEEQDNQENMNRCQQQ